MGLDLFRTGAYRAIEWMTLRCWRNSGDLPEKMFVITAQKHRKIMRNAVKNSIYCDTDTITM